MSHVARVCLRDTREDMNAPSEKMRKHRYTRTDETPTPQHMLNSPKQRSFWWGYSLPGSYVTHTRQEQTVTPYTRSPALHCEVLIATANNALVEYDGLGCVEPCKAYPYCKYRKKCRILESFLRSNLWAISRFNIEESTLCDSHSFSIYLSLPGFPGCGHAHERAKSIHLMVLAVPEPQLSGNRHPSE